ncbi:MAG: hypothetical protein SWY16_00570 [Cyanobacteriota bacterium]|nr:hypothetical protein [Cyanobacteriota bacterium]
MEKGVSDPSWSARSSQKARDVWHLRHGCTRARHLSRTLETIAPSTRSKEMDRPLVQRIAEGFAIVRTKLMANY